MFCKRVEQTIRPLYKTQTNALQASIIKSGATNTQSKQIAALIQEQSRNALLETISGTVAGFSGLDAGISETNPEFALENDQPLKTNRYGDAALTQLKGIISFGVEIITRVHTWTLATKPQVQKNAFCSHLEFCQ